MTVEERIQRALRSPQPAPVLRTLVSDLAREGHEKPTIVKLLEGFVVHQRTLADFREQDEEAMLDLLDSLHGWCHPTAELLPEKPIR